ncbi:MAG: SDR family oxidoreductase [Bacteroidota bacterium]
MNILILGATSDISRAIAHDYAQEGHLLLLAGRNLSELEKDATDLQIRYEVKAIPLKFDALDTDNHLAFYEALDPKPDLVFCVFGYLGDQKEQEEHWEKAEEVLKVNYLGAASILHHIANDFQKRGEGTIVGISSVAGERGRASNYFYGSAKAGFTAFLSGLRNRLFSSQVHVMTVIPGYVRTRMTEGMKLPGPLTADPQEVSTSIRKAIKKKANVLYVKGSWRWIMMIIKMIPENIFKKLSL